MFRLEENPGCSGLLLLRSKHKRQAIQEQASPWLFAGPSSWGQGHDNICQQPGRNSGHPRALFPRIPDIYAHKAPTPLKKSELDLLEKWLRVHEPIQKEIVDEWLPRLVWEVREGRKKAEEV